MTPLKGTIMKCMAYLVPGDMSSRPQVENWRVGSDAAMMNGKFERCLFIRIVTGLKYSVAGTPEPHHCRSCYARALLDYGLNSNAT